MKKYLKIYINAPITLTFVLICVIATIADKLTGGISTDLFFSTYRDSLANPLMYIRLIGHIFGHADLIHLLNNMTYILLLGPILEEKYHHNLIPIIGTVALITGILHNLFSESILLGASGIVFAFILLSSVTGNQEGIPLTLIFVAIFYLGNEIISAFGTDNISQMTHIIGGLCGAGLGLYIKKVQIDNAKTVQ